MLIISMNGLVTGVRRPVAVAWWLMVDFEVRLRHDRRSPPGCGRRGLKRRPLRTSRVARGN